MNRLRFLAACLAGGLAATVLGAAASLPFHGVAAVAVWTGVACATAGAAGVYLGVRSAGTGGRR